MNYSLKFYTSTLLKIVVCIAAFVSLVPGGAGSLVLCLGEDGHIAVEFEHGNPCHYSHDHPEKPSDGHQESMPDDPCCSCLDIPITFDIADRDQLDDNAHKNDRLLLGELSPCNAIAINRTETDSSIFANLSPPPIYRSLVLLQTTVLLN